MQNHHFTGSILVQKLIFHKISTDDVDVNVYVHYTKVVDNDSKIIIVSCSFKRNVFKGSQV